MATSQLTLPYFIFLDVFRTFPKLSDVPNYITWPKLNIHCS